MKDINRIIAVHFSNPAKQKQDLLRMYSIILKPVMDSFRDKGINVEDLLEKINESEEVKKEYVIDIFPKFNVENANIIKEMNISLANKQFIHINKMITYIDGKNYFGDAYHNYKAKQIEATDNWIHEFFPNSNDEVKKLVAKYSKLL
jgi:hypothetical protein